MSSHSLEGAGVCSQEDNLNLLEDQRETSHRPSPEEVSQVRGLSTDLLPAGCPADRFGPAKFSIDTILAHVLVSMFMRSRNTAGRYAREGCRAGCRALSAVRISNKTELWVQLLLIDNPSQSVTAGRLEEGAVHKDSSAWTR